MLKLILFEWFVDICANTARGRADTQHERLVGVAPSLCCPSFAPFFVVHAGERTSATSFGAVLEERGRVVPTLASIMPHMALRHVLVSTGASALMLTDATRIWACFEHEARILATLARSNPAWTVGLGVLASGLTDVAGSRARTRHEIRVGVARIMVPRPCLALFFGVFAGDDRADAARCRAYLQHVVRVLFAFAGLGPNGTRLVHVLTIKLADCA